MGNVASVKVKAISLGEASEMVCSMKRLEKESLGKARRVYRDCPLKLSLRKY